MQFEAPHTKEAEAKLEFFVDRGIEEALLTIKENFETNHDIRERLPYHNRAHTESVVSRTSRIVTALRTEQSDLVPERIVHLARLAAGFHDLVQKWEEQVVEEHGERRVMRKRNAEANEEMSARMLEAYARTVNEKQSEGVFSEEDIALGREAVMTTIPEFNSVAKTVIQSRLTPDASLVSRAVALADIGAAGLDGPEVFVEEGNALFREENLDIADTLVDPEWDAKLTPAKKRYFRDRMLAWSHVQALFAQGRKLRLVSDLEGLEEDARDTVRKLFCHFDASIEAARLKTAARQNMPFIALARDFGYRLQ